MFGVNIRLGSSSGPHWSHGNLLLDVNGNWIRPVTGYTERNPRCCITNELSTEVFPLLWEAATGNCCYLSVERLQKNGCQMSKLPASQRVFSNTENVWKSKQKRIPPSERDNYLGLSWGIGMLENSKIMLLIFGNLSIDRAGQCCLNLFPWTMMWNRILQVFTCQIESKTQQVRNFIFISLFITKILYSLPSSFHAWSAVEAADTLCMLFCLLSQTLQRGQAFCCNVCHSPPVSIHLRSSHSTTVRKEDVVIHPFLKNDSKRKLHALKWHTSL